MGFGTSYVNLALTSPNEKNDWKTLFWEAKAEPIIEKYSMHLRKVKHLDDSSDVLTKQGRTELARAAYQSVEHLSNTSQRRKYDPN